MGFSAKRASKSPAGWLDTGSWVGAGVAVGAGVGVGDGVGVGVGLGLAWLSTRFCEDVETCVWLSEVSWVQAVRESPRTAHSTSAWIRCFMVKFSPCENTWM